MARIDSYATVTPPVAGGDMLIGTDINDNNATKNFTVSQLASFINAGSGFVPYTGATQNVNIGTNSVFGASSTFTGLTSTAQLNITSLFKLNGSQGTAGQILTTQGPGLPAIWSGAGGGPQGIQGPVGPQGPIGPVGPAGLNWQGLWVSGTSYVADDAVGYNGASWFCILATTGTTTPDLDTTHWALLASQGAQGLIGPTGLQGPTGATGPTGVTGSNTLQQVLDNNHDLLNGINKQGTGAGSGNIGLSVNAFGTDAAYGNTGDNINAIGTQAGQVNFGSLSNFIGYQAGANNSGGYVNALGATAANGNSGSSVNAMGQASCLSNTGTYVNAFGYQSGKNNTGNWVNAFGYDAALNNTNFNVNAIGNSAAANNSGHDVNAFGEFAGISNIYNHVNLFGNSASATANSQVVFSNAVRNARIGFGGITTDRLYTLPDASGTLALESYKVFTALLTASGTSLFVTELKNTIGTISYLSYGSGTGVYFYLTSASLFTDNKTVVIAGNSDSGVDSVFKASFANSNIIKIYNYVAGAVNNSTLVNIPIEIRVYP